MLAMELNISEGITLMDLNDKTIASFQPDVDPGVIVKTELQTNEINTEVSEKPIPQSIVIFFNFAIPTFFCISY